MSLKKNLCTMNLHKTLKAYNEANVQPEQELILNEAKSILGNAEKGELSILTSLGMDKNLKEFDRIESERKQAEYFDEIYDVSAIKKMAVHYGLRFLPAALYKGTIDPILPSVLNTFIAKHKIQVDNRKVRHRTFSWEEEQYNETGFYILAPASSFELQQRPKDPIMFYKINENKYAFIHKWGNDLSNSRKLANYFVRSTFHLSCLLTSIFALGVIWLSYISNEPVFLVFFIFSLFTFGAPYIIEFSSNEDNWNRQYL